MNLKKKRRERERSKVTNMVRDGGRRERKTKRRKGRRERQRDEKEEPLSRSRPLFLILFLLAFFYVCVGISISHAGLDQKKRKNNWPSLQHFFVFSADGELIEEGDGETERASSKRGATYELNQCHLLPNIWRKKQEREKGPERKRKEER
ncbi:MAG: hypothetical protein JOS17DRAFT_497054 [Linnemannia elongata]|nr:MAG: hypothetical protein JOS17DRAFT_497054 [Linnemannia elongata]